MTAPHPTPQDEHQPFEDYPALAGKIENLGWKVSGISISTWSAFLAEINTTILKVRSDEREACANIADGCVALASKAADDAKYCDEDYHQSYGALVEAQAIARAIRASGEK